MYSEFTVDVPDHDCDVTIKFPNGKIIQVQCRPSNADLNYNGSLDIILPEDTPIICWIGDDMAPAPHNEIASLGQHHRIVKQIVMELPDDFTEEDEENAVPVGKTCPNCFNMGCNLCWEDE